MSNEIQKSKDPGEQELAESPPVQDSAAEPAAREPESGEGTAEPVDSDPEAGENEQVRPCRAREDYVNFKATFKPFLKADIDRACDAVKADVKAIVDAGVESTISAFKDEIGRLEEAKQADPPQTVQEDIQALYSEVDKLRTRFEESLKSDETRNAQAHRLHEEGLARTIAVIRAEIARIENAGKAATLQTVQLGVQALHTEVEKLRTSFDGKLRYDETKQTQVDRLHEELQLHKGNLVEQLKREPMKALIGVYDNIGKLLAALRRKPEEDLTPERFFDEIEGIMDDVEMELEHFGVSPYRSSDGATKFDPRRQRQFSQTDTQDEQLARTVAKTVLPGFEQGDTILVKERVSIYRYVAPEEPPPAVAEPTPEEAGVDAAKLGEPPPAEAQASEDLVEIQPPPEPNDISEQENPTEPAPQAEEKKS